MVPAIIARFNFGKYETTDKRMIELMLIRVIKNKRYNMQQTFVIHPEDLGEANSYLQEIDKRSTLELEDTTKPISSHEPKENDKLMSELLEQMQTLTSKVQQLESENNNLKKAVKKSGTTTETTKEDGNVEQDKK